MFLVIFYLIVIIVTLVIFTVSYISHSISRNRFQGMWTLPFLRVTIPLMTTAFFLPILFSLLSIIACFDNKNIYIQNVSCWSGMHYTHSVFSVIFGVVFIIFSGVIQMIYFENKFNVFNPRAKSTSKADLIFLASKAICVILFSAVNPIERNKYLFIIFLLFLGGYVIYSYYDIIPYYNSILMKAYKGLSLIFFWSTITLTLSLIFEGTYFDGGLSLFFLGIPIIVFIIFTEHDDVMTILLTHMIKSKNGQMALTQIRYVLDLIDKKNNDRNAKILLKGYIFQYETNCIISDCPLKKYIDSLNKNTESLLFLLQHVESMYQVAIAKFPIYTKLRLSFVSFLFERMNKKKQASIEIKNTEKNHTKFEEEFIIYRNKRLLEENVTDLGDIDDNLDIVSNIEYKHHLTLFKNAISKASTLYIDFWSLLSTPNKDNKDDLTQLNDYGSKINVLVEEIRNHFDKIQKLKYNDQDAVSLYSDFLNDVLNDKEKSTHYKNNINQTEEPKNSIEDSNLLFNMENNALNTNEEYQYVIVSALPDKFGIIINISLGICNIFGYAKSELIGKMLEVIMPEIYHKGHREILKNKVNDFKKLSINIIDLKKYQPQFKIISTYGKTKSRYLIQINLKTSLIPNEESDIMFVCKLWQNSININSTFQTCFIITNSYLTIQNFTANAVNLLGMDSSAINSSVDITEFIKQFNEEFLKYVIENEEKTFEQKLLLKRTIISKKYKNPTMISWKKSDDMFDTKPRSKIEINTSNVSYDDNHNYFHNQTDNHTTKHQLKSTKIINEELFILTVQDVTLRNIQEGYIFKFESQLFKKREMSSSSLIRPTFKIYQNERISSSQNLKKELKFEEAYNRHKASVTKLFSFDQSEDLAASSLMVDKSFVPSSNLNFQLDPLSLAYMPYESNPINCKEYLKNEAIKRLKQTATIQSSDDSSDDHESKVSSSGYQSDSVSSKSNTDEESDEIIVNQKKETLITKSKEEYYKVNVSIIKYSQYDFGRGTVVEIKDYDKTDQVQWKLTDDNKNKEGIVNVQTESKEKKEKNSFIHTNDIINNQERGSLLIKQIEYALEKEETQPTIQKMKWICFVVLLLLLLCGGGLMGLILELFKVFKENANVIEKAYDLIILNNYGIYYIRELTLLNNDNYTSIPIENKVEYIASYYNATLSTFIQAHNLLGDIITSFLPLSSNHSFLLNSSTISSTIINDDYSISTFDLSLLSSFIETNVGLFHIGKSNIKQAYPTQKDIFFYLFNSLNQMVQGYSLQASVYFNQYDEHFQNALIYFICTFIAILILLVGIFAMMSNGYNGVVKRKESYLEVFFEIGTSIIRASLEKCEHFNKKLHADSMNDIMSSSYDNDIEENSVVTGSEVKREHKHQRKNEKRSKETEIFHIKAVFLLSLVAIFSCVVSLVFLLYLDKIKRYMQFYKNKTELEAQYLFLFNTLREYMFDPTSKVMNTSSEEYLVYFLEEFYITIQNKNKAMESMIESIPNDYSIKHTEINLNSACDYRGLYFSENDNCSSFMSNLPGFGLDIVLSYFVEEIRFMKSFTNKHINQQKNSNSNLIYNLTLSNTELGQSYWPPFGSKDYETYIQNDQINIFNNNDHHLKLNIMFSSLILPNFHVLSMTLRDTIESNLQTAQLVFIIIISIYLGIVLIGYVLFWLPFSQQLNRTIYKTKNMLSIIPKEVLASLANIHKLLDIGQNIVNASNKGSTNSDCVSLE